MKSRSYRWRRLFVTLAAAFIIAWLAAWAAAQWLIVRAELSHADALVVLAGSSAYTERAVHAAQLFHEGRAPLVILTNDGKRGPWSDAQRRNPFFVERAVEELRQAGVPLQKIQVLPQLVNSTNDEAMLLRDYAGSHQLHSILLVTSAYHSRRALSTMRRTFEGTGLQVGLSSPTTGGATPSAATWWWHVDGWRTVAAEYPKLLYYALRY